MCVCHLSQLGFVLGQVWDMVVPTLLQNWDLRAEMEARWKAWRGPKCIRTGSKHILTLGLATARCMFSYGAVCTSKRHESSLPTNQACLKSLTGLCGVDWLDALQLQHPKSTEDTAVDSIHQGLLGAFKTQQLPQLKLPLIPSAKDSARLTSVPCTRR